MGSKDIHALLSGSATSLLKNIKWLFFAHRRNCKLLSSLTLYSSHIDPLSIHWTYSSSHLVNHYSSASSANDLALWWFCSVPSFEFQHKCPHLWVGLFSTLAKVTLASRVCITKQYHSACVYVLLSSECNLCGGKLWLSSSLQFKTKCKMWWANICYLTKT